MTSEPRLQVNINGSLTISNSWIVEDDPDSAKAIQSMLQSSGSTTRIFCNGAELLDAISSECDGPDIICLDLSLPDIAGLDLLPTIKKQHPHVPVVIVTNNTSSESIERAVELGVYDYLPKSSDRTKFTTTFKRAIEHYRLTQKLDNLNKEQVKVSSERVRPLNFQEKESITQALRASQGRLSQTAKLLGISRPTLYRKMKKYGLSTRGQF